MNGQNSITLKPNQRIINTYSKEEKDKFIDEYLKCSSTCTMSKFARENNIEFQTFQKWMKQRDLKQNNIKPIDIKPMIKKEDELITIIIHDIKIKTDKIGIKAIMGEIIK